MCLLRIVPTIPQPRPFGQIVRVASWEEGGPKRPRLTTQETGRFGPRASVKASKKRVMSRGTAAKTPRYPGLICAVPSGQPEAGLPGDFPADFFDTLFPARNPIKGHAGVLPSA
jgi:hypothetical protein